jgi:Ca2+-binding RTX toxin-like protein
VTLAPDASNSPQMASLAQGIVQFGPAIVFSTGQITVATQGSLGAGGSVTSTSTLQNINRSAQEPFTATSASSTCTATETDVSGSTTINNGVLRTSEGDPGIDGDETFVNVPTNPAPNTVINGTLEGPGDSFQYIFNEQIVNPDGAITVYAGHLRLLGPIAVGDLFWGKSECGVSPLPPLVTCAGLTATIVGTAGSDNLIGTPGPDVIAGLEGTDNIQGLGGDDVICGGGGIDRIRGGTGNDRLFGDAGIDQLFGEDGNDALDGGADIDQCNGDAGTDTATACDGVTGVP